MALTALLSGGGSAPAQSCSSDQSCPGDLNGDGTVTIDEILKAVNAALNGCPARPPTPTPNPNQRFVDNGDGTITDTQTGLMWEKKDQSLGIHDPRNLYTWGMDTAPYTMNGTMVTVFLAVLNTEPCFAGYCDWRIPELSELQSIPYDQPDQNLGNVIDAAFDSGCAANCSLVSCSCPCALFVWSSTTPDGNPSVAWAVHPLIGGVLTQHSKHSPISARAVRGGS